MTEPEQAEQIAEPTASNRHGRPRPTEVVDRDQRVLTHMLAQRDEAGAIVGQTREQVATALGLEGKQVYLSFYRLKRDGMITKNVGAGSQLWRAVEPAVTA